VRSQVKAERQYQKLEKWERGSGKKRAAGIVSVVVVVDVDGGMENKMEHYDKEGKRELDKSWVEENWDDARGDEYMRGDHGYNIVRIYVDEEVYHDDD